MNEILACTLVLFGLFFFALFVIPIMDLIFWPKVIKLLDRIVVIYQSYLNFLERKLK